MSYVKSSLARTRLSSSQARLGTQKHQKKRVLFSSYLLRGWYGMQVIQLAGEEEGEGGKKKG